MTSEKKDTTTKSFLLVIMPFSREFDDVYQLGIKTVCEKIGVYAERMDEQIYQSGIIERIYNQIAKADIIVADMTGKNPNVYYETGYAHALGKKVILITQNADDIPFDLKNYPHIIYEGRITALIPELERRLRFFMENPDDNVTLQRLIEPFIHGCSLDGHPVVRQIYRPEHLRFECKLDLNNPIGVRLKTQNLQFGIETSGDINKCIMDEDRYFNSVRKLNSVRLPEDRVIHISNTDHRILPGAWASVWLRFYVRSSSEIGVGNQLSATLKIFSSDFVHEFPFTIELCDVT